EIYTLSLHDALPIFVVGEVDCELLSVGDFRGYLHGKIGLIFAGEYLVGYEVQDLCELHGVMLADGKNDRLADLPTDRIAQCILRRPDWWLRQRSVSQTRVACRSPSGRRLRHP